MKASASSLQGGVGASEAPGGATAARKPGNTESSSGSASSGGGGGASTGNPRALRAVAVLEAFKGVLVFAAGFGLLSLLHRDVQELAMELVTRLHIDPDRHYPGLFIDAASRMTNARLWLFAVMAAAYSLLRWFEAYGLWTNKRWAAWLGVASGAIYVPPEVLELVHQPDAAKWMILLVNLLLVAYLAWTLVTGSKQKAPQ